MSAPGSAHTPKQIKKALQPVRSAAHFQSLITLMKIGMN
jgi:hypothetical protein